MVAEVKRGGHVGAQVGATVGRRVKRPHERLWRGSAIPHVNHGHRTVVHDKHVIQVDIVVEYDDALL